MPYDLETSRRAIDEWHLGQTSAHRESGGRGPGAISSGQGDHGGVSYGTYQLSTRMGTLREYLDQSSYANHFSGLTPNTPQFNERWRELARTDPGFGQDQHNFIQRTHYDKQNERLQEMGIDLSTRGRAVHDALWSTSVQYRNLTPTIFSRGLEERFGKGYDLSSLSDRDIIEAVQDYKINHNSTLFRSSPNLQPSLLARAEAEKTDLLRLAAQEHVLNRNGQVPDWAPFETLQRGSRGPAVTELQTQLRDLGYTDARGRPLVPDGDFGANTRHAVEAFQRDNGLKVNGTLDQATSGRLHELHEQHRAQQREQQPQTDSSVIQLNDVRHPDHELFKQAQAGVYKMDAQHGRTPDHCSDNLAACLVVAARRDGLKSIDHVALGTDASQVFAAEGSLRSSFKQITSVPTVESLNMPIAQSSQNWNQVTEQKAVEQQQQQVHEQNQQQARQQAHAAPSM